MKSFKFLPDILTTFGVVVFVFFLSGNCIENNILFGNTFVGQVIQNDLFFLIEGLIGGFKIFVDCNKAALPNDQIWSKIFFTQACYTDVATFVVFAFVGIANEHGCNDNRKSEDQRISVFFHVGFF